MTTCWPEADLSAARGAAPARSVISWPVPGRRGRARLLRASPRGHGQPGDHAAADPVRQRPHRAHRHRHRQLRRGDHRPGTRLRAVPQALSHRVVCHPGSHLPPRRRADPGRRQGHRPPALGMGRATSSGVHQRYRGLPDRLPGMRLRHPDPDHCLAHGRAARPASPASSPAPTRRWPHWQTWTASGTSSPTWPQSPRPATRAPAQSCRHRSGAAGSSRPGG